jgi:hypothetical protein
MKTRLSTNPVIRLAILTASLLALEAKGADPFPVSIRIDAAKTHS